MAMDFSVQYYMATYPDVQKAVESGQYLSAKDHWDAVGKNEGRRGVPQLPAGFNEEGYLNKNPDVKRLVESGMYQSGIDHYLDSGWAEGRTFDIGGVQLVDKMVSDQYLLHQYLTYVGNKQKTADQYDVSNRLFNQPFQFLDTADKRINSNIRLGRKYMEHIASNSKIVFFQPGSTNYLPSVSQTKKDSITEVFSKLATSAGDDSWVLSELISGDVPQKYFEFTSDYEGYMRYVNMLCRAASIFLGIGDREMPHMGESTGDGSESKGGKYKYYNWHNVKYKNFVKRKNSTSMFEKVKDYTVSSVAEALFGHYNYVQFYCDNSTSISETMSNTTGSSKLAGLLDTGSEWMKELLFIGGIEDSGAGGLAAGMVNSVNELTAKLASKDGALSKILGSSSEILTGASLIFPEIYQSSEYSKSYSFTFNLMSPYGDIESIYLNVYVPMFHLLALTLPRQTPKSANSYSSPYLVRGFSKGWFSTQMAIIEQLSIEKTEFNVDGFASAMKITLTLRDLYSDLMMSPTSHPTEFFSNSGMIDFLATLCGVDITKPQFVLYINTIGALLLNQVMDIPLNIQAEFMKNVRRITSPLYL